MGEKDDGGKERCERRYRSWAYLSFVVLDALMVLATVAVIYR